MNDYTERDKLLEQKPFTDRAEEAREAIKNAPAADVEAVVHCKDCRYLEFSDFYGECGRSYLGVVRPWDYCSRGARRNKEDNT